MGEFCYNLRLIEPGGSGYRDVTGLVQSISWVGDKGQAARELQVALAVPRDGSIEPLNLGVGCALQFSVEGRSRFTGQVVTATTSTQSAVVDLSALDGGRFLAGNQGRYSFSNTTPEAAVRAICGDFGIPVASLAATATPVSRKFPGTALDDILLTLYTMAGEQTGKRYLIRFTGEGALEVVEKPETASLEIARTMGVVNTWSVEQLVNRVEIRSDSGALLQVVEDGPSQALNGRLQQVLTQKKEDLTAQANSILEDQGVRQSLTVEVLDPPLELITGAAVLLRDTGSGVSGLFWVDSDTHTWKNRNHYGKFKLNFRNLMDETSTGREL